MKLKDFQVGQEVYCKPVYNEARYNPNLRKGEVVKVGKKYLTVKVEGRSETVQFDAEDEFRQKTEYCTDFILYPTKEAFEEDEEKKFLAMQIKKYFTSNAWSELSLEQLRAINCIIGKSFEIGDTVYVHYAFDYIVPAIIESYIITSKGLYAEVYIDPDTHLEYDVEDLYSTYEEAKKH